MIFDTNNNLKNKMLFDKKTEFYLIKIAKKTNVTEDCWQIV